MQKIEIINHFRKELFIPSMKAPTKLKVLEELVDSFVEHKLIKSKELAMEMLKRRETLGSTGLGKGIAIPHGRTTAAGDVIIGFGKSDAGVDFDAVDGKPVTLFFMVIAPPQDENNVYLPILGSLVTTLKVAANRKKLSKIETYEEFIEIFSGE
jgi:mannitol/fructose-specific phosphotransferase system IIA component (Ntr-type)